MDERLKKLVNLMLEEWSFNFEDGMTIDEIFYGMGENGKKRKDKYCKGTIFELDKHLYYRCYGYNTIMDNLDRPLLSFCPRCSRRRMPMNRHSYKDVRVRMVKQINLDSTGWTDFSYDYIIPIFQD